MDRDAGRLAHAAFELRRRRLIALALRTLPAISESGRGLEVVAAIGVSGAERPW